MHKTITSKLFLPPSVREIGFGVAAFRFAPGRPAGEKTADLPAIFPRKPLPDGRKT